MAGNRLEKPNMYNRRSQIDMPHALSSDTAVSHLYAAPITDNALELGALVLAAGALVVPLGTEDALAEEAVLLGAVRTVIDRLWL